MTLHTLSVIPRRVSVPLPQNSPFPPHTCVAFSRIPAGGLKTVLCLGELWIPCLAALQSPAVSFFPPSAVLGSLPLRCPGVPRSLIPHVLPAPSRLAPRYPRESHHSPRPPTLSQPPIIASPHPPMCRSSRASNAAPLACFCGSLSSQAE